MILKSVSIETEIFYLFEDFKFKFKNFKHIFISTPTNWILLTYDGLFCWFFHIYKHETVSSVKGYLVLSVPIPILSLSWVFPLCLQHDLPLLRKNRSELFLCLNRERIPDQMSPPDTSNLVLNADMKKWMFCNIQWSSFFFYQKFRCLTQKSKSLWGE